MKIYTSYFPRYEYVEVDWHYPKFYGGYKRWIFAKGTTYIWNYYIILGFKIILMYN